MKQIRIRILPPADETIPVHRAIQSADTVERAVLLSGGVDSSDPTELFSFDGQRDRVLPVLDDQPGIRSVELLSEERGTTYVYVREMSQERTIAEAFTANTLVVTLPIQFRADGAVEMSVLGSRSDLQSAVEFVRSRADVSVLAIRDRWTDGSPQPSTDRQRTVLCTAYDAGYYDYPRTTTQEDVAAEAGITGSTVAEILRNAERALVEQEIGDT